MALHWAEVRDTIKKDDRGKLDMLATPADLQWTIRADNLMVSVGDAKPYYLSSWAESDLCNSLGIPVKYFRECPPELKRMQVEFLIKNRLSNKIRWRLRLRNKIVRAFVSEHYQPFDNNKVVSLWERKGNPELFDYQLMLDDTFFFLRALAQDEAYSHAELGGLRTGVFIRNSEVGRSALAMGASVYRLICKNGMVEVFDKNSPLYQRHIWIDEVELTRRMDEAVFEALEMAQHTTDRFKKARSIPAGLERVVSTLDRFKLNERVQQSVIDLFVSEGDNSAFGMVNALTAAARGLSPYDRHGLEALAWQLLTTVTGE